MPSLVRGPGCRGSLLIFLKLSCEAHAACESLPSSRPRLTLLLLLGPEESHLRPHPSSWVCGRRTLQLSERVLRKHVRGRLTGLRTRDSLTPQSSPPGWRRIFPMSATSEPLNWRQRGRHPLGDKLPRHPCQFREFFGNPT